MSNLNKDIAELSGCLQSLTTSEFASQVEEAVEKKDKDSLIKICRNAKIPIKYVHSVVTTLLNMSSPQQKYPDNL
jgi:deoxyhypusine synthase